MTVHNIALLLLVLTLLEVHCQDTGPVVVTDSGDVRGFVDVDRLNITYDAFLGIPFAKPPVEELRWKRTEPVEPWEGIYNATEWSDHCIQPITILYPFVDFNSNDSEDCLYLNIWVPQSVNYALGNPLPVMMFYYGGGFDIGTGEMYPGDALATAGDVIVVNANYRVSMMGFFSTGDDTSPGNYGLWDAKASLEWLIANIEYFGGDPSRITIFGQSAGAGVVTHMMLSGQTNTLFHRAVAISGKASLQTDEETNRRLGFLNDTFECNSTNNQDLVDCLSAYDAKELDNRAFLTAFAQDYSLDWGVVVDGYFTDQDIRDSWTEGRGGDLDFMTGSTLHDSAGFVVGKPLGAPSINETNDYNRNNEFLYERWYEAFDQYDNVEEVVQTLYDRFPEMNSTDDAVATQSHTRVETDFKYGSTVFYQAEKHDESGMGGSTYFWVFQYRQSFLGGYPQWCNGSHLDDMYSILGDSYMTVFREAVLGEYSEDDWTMNDILMKYYANFAYTGDPNQGPHTGNVMWPAYDVTSRQYLLQTPTPVVDTITQDVVDHYNWFLYNLTGMVIPEWGQPTYVGQ